VYADELISLFLRPGRHEQKKKENENRFVQVIKDSSTRLTLARAGNIRRGRPRWSARAGERPAAAKGD
jgi:hypothetical protein